MIYNASAIYNVRSKSRFEIRATCINFPAFCSFQWKTEEIKNNEVVRREISVKIYLKTNFSNFSFDLSNLLKSLQHLKRLWGNDCNLNGNLTSSFSRYFNWSTINIHKRLSLAHSRIKDRDTFELHEENVYSNVYLHTKKSRDIYETTTKRKSNSARFSKAN